ncbi:myb-like protein AA [Tigriopus californicus]|uniref:myb-like protein AA n=1 Tax=Tigriopus californicus TaxID=6832 RepID=UPI0027DA0A56|nr:myb-like protein AA [Tigriopus californicus]
MQFQTSDHDFRSRLGPGSGGLLANNGMMGGSNVMPPTSNHLDQEEGSSEDIWDLDSHTVKRYSVIPTTPHFEYGNGASIGGMLGDHGKGGEGPLIWSEDDRCNGGINSVGDLHRTRFRPSYANYGSPQQQQQQQHQHHQPQSQSALHHGHEHVAPSLYAPSSHYNVSNPASVPSPSTPKWQSSGAPVSDKEETKKSKSYQCNACDKWFTSSGHLKRHYNTTLHKNAMRHRAQSHTSAEGVSPSLSNYSTATNNSMSPHCFDEHSINNQKSFDCTPTSLHNNSSHFNPSHDLLHTSVTSPNVPISPSSSSPSSNPATPTTGNATSNAVTPSSVGSNHIGPESGSGNVQSTHLDGGENASNFFFDRSNSNEPQQQQQQQQQQQPSQQQPTMQDLTFSQQVHMSTKLAANRCNSTNSSLATEYNQNMKVQMNSQTSHPCIYTPPPSRPLSNMNMNQQQQQQQQQNNNSSSQSYLSASPSPQVSGLYALDPYHHSVNTNQQQQQALHLQQQQQQQQQQLSSTGESASNLQSLQTRTDALHSGHHQSCPPNNYSENMLSAPSDMYHVQYGSYDYGNMDEYNSTAVYGINAGNGTGYGGAQLGLNAGFTGNIDDDYSLMDKLNPQQKALDVKPAMSGQESASHGSPSSNDAGLGEYKCNDCNKVFTRICYLKQHNKSFHNGEKPYKCGQCGKRFPVEMLYQEHLAKHAGDKPYKCDVCPKQFNHKTDLRRHMCLHTGEKPFSCDVCGKGFIREDRMIKHSDTHKKKQPLMIQ